MRQEDLIYRQASKILNIPENTVKQVYTAYWKAIRECITADPILLDMSEEEFNKAKRNVCLPNLGKLSCTYQHYLRKLYNKRSRTEYYENQKNNTPA